MIKVDKESIGEEMVLYKFSSQFDGYSKHELSFKVCKVYKEILQEFGKMKA